MMTHPHAGKPASSEVLTDIPALLIAYHDKPDIGNPAQRVSFGTSGHRGCAFAGSFNETHILAITQAICEYRQQHGITGPLLLGKDTHGLSGPAQRTAIEVLAANRVQTHLQAGDGFTPTPVISRAILAHNLDAPEDVADGIVITPSHNPPQDGGIKYNPPHGGPADTNITNWIEQRANRLIADDNREVKRLPYAEALAAESTHRKDFLESYVEDLCNVIDMDAIRRANLKIGVDPMGGAAVDYWRGIADRYDLNIEVVNPRVDPAFAFMMLDHDGNIRMDCSSPYAMAGLMALRDRFDIAWGNDADVDRHGIVTPSSGLMNPNHYLAVAIHYLLTHRPDWPSSASVGKTLVSSSLIDRVINGLGRTVLEMPVGFKWFASGLFDASCCFGGEESAGASFLRRDGSVWTTDKDGIILGLLAAEITAVTGKDPGLYYQELTQRHGTPYYLRIDAPATPTQKQAFKRLRKESIDATTLGGDPVIEKLTHAPGSNSPIGGIKIVTAHGWFAARPSGTEDVYKLYAESFKSIEHLHAIVKQALNMVNGVLNG